jgi:hypothetical protein
MLLIVFVLIDGMFEEGMFIDGMFFIGMFIDGMFEEGMFIDGMFMPIDIIMFAEGTQRSSSCSRVGRQRGDEAGVRRRKFDARPQIQ